MDTLGERIKYLRDLHNLSQKELADQIKISRSNISKIERNLITPSASEIISIANIFEVTTDWLLIGDAPALRDKFKIHLDSLKSAASEDGKAQEISDAERLEQAKDLLYRLNKEKLGHITEYMKFELYLQDTTKKR